MVLHRPIETARVNQDLGVFIELNSAHFLFRRWIESGAISAYARKSAAASNRTQLVDIIQSINTYLGFFLRPEGQWPGLSSKGSYRVRLHHEKPCNRRVTHAVGGCRAEKAGKACHAFHRAVVLSVPNDPLFVSLPDFVAHLAPTFSANLDDGTDMPLRRCNLKSKPPLTAFIKICDLLRTEVCSLRDRKYRLENH